jgi:hypothetical protein
MLRQVLACVVLAIFSTTALAAGGATRVVAVAGCTNQECDGPTLVGKLEVLRVPN